MSMFLMVKAMQAKVGNPLRKLVLIKLADNANDDGECWPSYQHIAGHCEISRATVKNHVRALEEMGLVRREFRRAGKLNRSNLFHLTLDAVGQQIPEGGSADDLGGVNDDPPRAADNPGGGAADDPRTYQSLETINEAINEAAVSKPKKRFTPPTQTEVLDHMLTKHLQFDVAELESEKFINFYESKGWLVGKTKMKNWKAAASNWVARCQTEKKTGNHFENSVNQANRLFGG